MGQESRSGGGAQPGSQPRLARYTSRHCMQPPDARQTLIVARTTSLQANGVTPTKPNPELASEVAKAAAGGKSVRWVGWARQDTAQALEDSRAAQAGPADFELP